MFAIQLISVGRNTTWPASQSNENLDKNYRQVEGSSSSPGSTHGLHHEVFIVAKFLQLNIFI